MYKILALILLSVMLFPASGARFPDYYPTEITTVGVVNSIDKETGTIVVNGKSFPLSGETLIHTLRDRYATLDAIQEGAKIAFRLQGYGGNRYMLIEIWLLPDDYPLQLGYLEIQRSMSTQPA